MHYDVIIIGGGAAGLMAAITVASKGCSTLILDPHQESGKKLLVTGNGKCNLTNLDFDVNKSNEWFKEVEGLPYGYHNFLSCWINTVDKNLWDDIPLIIKEVLIPMISPMQLLMTAR